jgi:hypothetical protein
MGLDATSRAVAGVIFGTKRGSDSAEKIAAGHSLSGGANVVRTGVSAVNTAESVNVVTNGRLTGIAQRVTGGCTEDAAAFLGKSYKFLRGFGLGANLLYAGTKALEQDSVLDGGIIAFSSIGGMYAAEHAYVRGIAGTTSCIERINPNEAKGVLKFLVTASQSCPKGRWGSVLKGIGFIVASLSGAYACEKAGEFVTKH